MNERIIQLAIHEYRSSIGAFPMLVPNVYHWGWEADVLYITKSLYAIEFEIKRTLSDFRADFKKVYKHMIIGSELPGKYSMTGKVTGPKEFWYVCPEGIIPLEEVPPYAGLIYISEERRDRKDGWGPSYADAVAYHKVIRKAPARDVSPLSASTVRNILHKGACRYWSNSLHCERYHVHKYSQPEGGKS